MPRLEVQDPSVFQPQITSPKTYGGYYQGGYIPFYYYRHLAGGIHHGWEPQYYKGYYQETAPDGPLETYKKKIMWSEMTLINEETLPVVEKTAGVKCQSSGKVRRKRTCFSQHQRKEGLYYVIQGKRLV